jgi:TolA-binding protein/outer membrane protein assembly factor BamB
MPFLEITHLTGDTEQRPLEKRQPVSIGSHASNDVRIDEEGVDPLHCRISWSKTGFEAVSVGVEGLQVNGNIVQRAILKPGDVLRFGTVDLRFRESDDDGYGEEVATAAKAGSGESSGSIDLKPLSDEIDIPDWLKPSPSAPAPAPPPSAKTPSKPVKPSAPAAPVKSSKESAAARPAATSKPAVSNPVKPETKASPKAEASGVEAKPAKVSAEKKPAPAPAREKSRSAPPPEPEMDFDLDAGLEALASESRTSVPTSSGRKEESSKRSSSSKAEPPKADPKAERRSKKPIPEPEPEAELDADVFEDDGEEEAAPPKKAPVVEPAVAKVVEPVADPITPKMRSALKHQRVRPGDEDVLRSPLVLGLSITAVVVLLAAGIFYLIGFRRSVQEEFDIAKAQFDENKYAQAISEFEGFLTRHPDDSRAADARKWLGLSKIDQLTTGAAPKYEDGMAEFKTFIADQRDLPTFPEVQPMVTERAAAVAVGSATAAGKSFAPALLDVSRESKTILTTYSPKEAPPTEKLKEIDALIAASQAAILKHETYEGLLAQINKELDAQRPLEALKVRRELLARYGDVEKDKKLVEATQKTLEAERAIVKEETLDREPVRDALVSPAGVTLVYQARTRTDQVSVQRAVPVSAGDSVFGIDTVTGAPVWKRSVGRDTPFFPVRDSASNTLVMFDAGRGELIRIRQNNGEVLWRQPIDEAVTSRPLVDEGQIYLATSGSLYRIELESGVASSKLTFSQPISNPVALSDGKRLVVAGDREVFYTLTKRPFACVSVSYLGQPSQSVVAPLLAMGPYVLAAENKASGGSHLRLLDTEPSDQPIREVASADIAGEVVDAPTVRGQNLFVPSTGERVASFTVLADAGANPLSTGPTYEVKGAQPSVTYLATAPDSEVFMASTALRKLQLTVDALQPAQEAVLLGMASQPLQYQDRLMFVARQRPFSEAVVMTPIDRGTLNGDWQAIVGAKIIAASTTTGDAPSLVCATEAGELFRVTSKLLDAGGFLSVAERLPLNDQLTDPLFATPLPEGQMLVACGLPDPKLWLINRLGQIERSVTLPVPLQTAPAMLGTRVLVAVPGKLQLIQSSSGQQAAQEFRLPSDLEGVTQWKQVVSTGPDNAIAVLDNGLVLLIRIQKDPKTHVAEAARFNLEAPLAGVGALGNEMFAVAATDGHVAVLTADGLEPKGERRFPSGPSAGPWVSGDDVFVEIGGTELHAMTADRELSSRWTLQLPGSHVAGAPWTRGDVTCVPLQDGRVLKCSAATGEIQESISLNVTITGSPYFIGEQVLLPTLDGSLVKFGGAQP